MKECSCPARVSKDTKHYGYCDLYIVMKLTNCIKCQKPSRNELCGTCSGRIKQMNLYKSPYKEAGISAVANNGTYPLKS